MFNDKFVELLQIKGLKPYHVATATKISAGLMSEYKNGIKTPTVDNLIKIADFLDCSIDYLLGRTENVYAHKDITMGIAAKGGITSTTANATEADADLEELAQRKGF